MKNGALALVGTAAIPSFLTRAVMAQATAASASRKKLVVIFQRGAADGLNIVVPHAEPSYFQMRPTIAIPQQQILDLDGFFGLHPAMASLKPLWDEKHLAIVHAAGSPDMTRSHFDAQDYMESGTPGIKATEDGWLNRALQAEDERRREAETPFRAVALTAEMPRTLEGKVPRARAEQRAGFSCWWRDAGECEFGRTALKASMTSRVIRCCVARGGRCSKRRRCCRRPIPRDTPAAGAEYPKGGFGDSMKQIAQLLKANLGVEAAFADIGGWDHHQNEGSVNGQLAGRLREFSESLSAFWTDMGTQAEDVVVVTMSEFGRTARENGTRGTDHGHANVMFVMGGPVKGGRVYGRWPGLAPEQLNEGRDLAVTTDFRQVLAEAAFKQIGARDLNLTFPGAEFELAQFLEYPRVTATASVLPLKCVDLGDACVAHDGRLAVGASGLRRSRVRACRCVPCRPFFPTSLPARSSGTCLVLIVDQCHVERFAVVRPDPISPWDIEALQLAPCLGLGGVEHHAGGILRDGDQIFSIGRPRWHVVARGAGHDGESDGWRGR